MKKLSGILLALSTSIVLWVALYELARLLW